MQRPRRHPLGVLDQFEDGQEQLLMPGQCLGQFPAVQRLRLADDPIP